MGRFFMDFYGVFSNGSMFNAIVDKKRHVRQNSTNSSKKLVFSHHLILAKKQLEHKRFL